MTNCSRNFISTLSIYTFSVLCRVFNIGFPGQFRRFVIPFDERVIQIREKKNLGHEIRRSVSWHWKLYIKG